MNGGLPAKTGVGYMAGRGRSIQISAHRYLITSPCGRDCTERHEGCHGRCERYQKWREGKERQREQERKERELYAEAWCRKREAVKDWNRRNRK